MFLIRSLLYHCFQILVVSSLFKAGLSGKKLLVPESILEKEICMSLGVQGHELTEELVAEKLVSLELNDADLRDLRGLEVASNLEVLILRDNLIEDLSPLRNLSKLRKLDLSGNRIKSLDTLTRFPIIETKSRILKIQDSLQQKNLKDEAKGELVLEITDLANKFKSKNNSLLELNLSNNRLLGITGIEMFEGIRWLNISDNSLIDLEGLSKLKSLTTLYLQGNQLGRVEGYEDVNRNKTYDLGEPVIDQSGNGKRDTNPLVEIRSLPLLRNLYLYDNMIKSVAGLEDLPSLSVLLLSGNTIEDIREIGKLKSVSRLSLNSNFIYDLTGLQELTNLRHLDLTENRICDLRPVESLQQLKELRLQSNHILDISPLARLEFLQTLSLAKNIIFDPHPLRNLTSLRSLKISDNHIDLDNPRFKTMFDVLSKGGCRTETRNQFQRSYSLEMLVGSLASFSSSNRDLGRFLQEKGYLRLIDFILDATVDDKTKETLYLSWDESFKRGAKVEELDFPEK